MLSPEVVSIVVLVVVFAVSIWRGVNMGAVALVAAFVLGTAYFGLSASEVAAGFSGSLFITLVGVTLLFAIARSNGTVDWVVRGTVNLARGRAIWIPWIFFLLAAAITASGAITSAANAILAPIGLTLAQRYRVNPLLVGLAILNGSNAGGFSPISVYFTIVNGGLEQAGIDVNAASVFIATLLFNLVLNLVAFAVLGGFRLRGSILDVTLEQNAAESRGSRPLHAFTLSLLVAIVLSALLFDLDVGFMALGAAVLLSLLFPSYSQKAVESVAWGVVLLVGGVVTYIAVLQSAGVVDNLSGSVAGIGQPLLAALMICFVGGGVSAFASTNAMFGILVPLSVPLVGAGGVGVLGFVIALCIASSAVDSSPFSTGGALVVANTEEGKRDKVFRALVIWGLSMIVVAPLSAWFIFVFLPS